MICTDHLLRDAMLNAKINLEQFDNIVEAAKSIMYERTQEKNPAAKVVNVLNRILEG